MAARTGPPSYTLHYFSCIPELAFGPLPEESPAGPDGHADHDARIYHCVRLDPALIYNGPADGSFWGDRFYGPGAMPGYKPDDGPAFHALTAHAEFRALGRRFALKASAVCATVAP